MFFAEDVEDGRQSVISVDETHSSICHAMLKLFQSCSYLAILRPRIYVDKVFNRLVNWIMFFMSISHRYETC